MLSHDYKWNVDASPSRTHDPECRLCHLEARAALVEELVRVVQLYRDSHHVCIKSEPQGLCNKCQRAEAVLAKASQIETKEAENAKQ